MHGLLRGFGALAGSKMLDMSVGYVRRFNAKNAGAENLSHLQQNNPI